VGHFVSACMHGGLSLVRKGWVYGSVFAAPTLLRAMSCVTLEALCNIARRHQLIQRCAIQTRRTRGCSHTWYQTYSLARSKTPRSEWPEHFAKCPAYAYNASHQITNGTAVCAAELKKRTCENHRHCEWNPRDKRCLNNSCKKSLCKIVGNEHSDEAQIALGTHRIFSQLAPSVFQSGACPPPRSILGICAMQADLVHFLLGICAMQADLVHFLLGWGWPLHGSAPVPSPLPWQRYCYRRCHFAGVVLRLVLRISAEAAGRLHGRQFQIRYRCM
jgi:hypothetical protein